MDLFDDPDPYQIKEVFAYFGNAMYQAQCLERTLAILLATEYGPGPRKITRTQFEDLLGSHFKETLGKLISHIRGRNVEISKEHESMLSEALQKRNWLTHNYFWERAYTFLSEEGRCSMIEELKQIAAFFTDVDLYFTAVTERWGAEHGITETEIQRIMLEHMGNSR